MQDHDIRQTALRRNIREELFECFYSPCGSAKSHNPKIITLTLTGRPLLPQSTHVRIGNFAHAKLLHCKDDLDQVYGRAENVKCSSPGRKREYEMRDIERNIDYFIGADL